MLCGYVMIGVATSGTDSPGGEDTKTRREGTEETWVSDLDTRRGKTMAQKFEDGVAYRSIITLAIMGTLAIIIAGLLRPNSPQATSTIALQAGSTAPNFTLTTPGGKRISLSDYRGKPVMLNFWYATCPGCLTEIPGIQKFYATQHTAGKDAVILGMNILDNAQTVAQFVQQHGLTYPMALDQNQQVMALYHVNSTPASYFIDRQGIIRSIVIGPVEDIALQQHMVQIS